MPDHIKHPGIQKELNNVEECLGEFEEKFDVATRSDQAMTAIVRLGEAPAGQLAQQQVNQILGQLIERMGDMTVKLSEAVRHLKSAVDLLSKETPKPEPHRPYLR